MNTSDSQESDANAIRMAGAEIISAKAREIGKENGVIISECVWDIGKDFRLQHAHRLDLITATDSVRLYFPDLELTAPDSETRKRKTDDRLRDAIARLLPRSPSPTYATSA